MSVLRNVLETLPRSNVVLETFDRTGSVVNRLRGGEFVECIRRFRGIFDTLDGPGRKVVALLFKSEETIEFLVAAFAAISRGFTIVPLYPSWSSETQLEYIKAYRLRSLCVGQGFRSRLEAWRREASSGIDQVLPVDVQSLLVASEDLGDTPVDFDLPADHPCAWIFTSGTSGKLAKLTEISRRNLEAAIENIHGLDFLRPGMTIHSPLSASHIFAFVATLGFLALKPRRVIFSDVQFLPRLPQAKTGKVDGMILVPIVLNRMRASFYEKLVSKLEPVAVPAELRKLARIPLAVRKVLKRIMLRAEEAVITLESTGSMPPSSWAAVQLARRLFGKMFRERLGSPEFVVVGGAKPGLQGMAFLEVLGIRCLQGWGMTETTGPLAVCTLRDRFTGALGTCGNLFPRAKAFIEDGELIVEGPQIARGYHQPDGTFVPFNGRMRTGDHAEFDKSGRLKVLGKASDRITTDNGINYNPIPLEEELQTLDLKDQQLIEEVVVIGDGQPRLGAVFFLREGIANDATCRAYLQALVRAVNNDRAVDEKIGPWVVSSKPFKDAGVIGPSGKLLRLRVEERHAHIFGVAVEIA